MFGRKSSKDNEAIEALKRENDLLRAKIRLITGKDADATLSLAGEAPEEDGPMMSFEGIEEGIIEFSPDGRAKYANRIVRELIGRDETGIKGKSASELDLLPWAPGLFQTLSLDAVQTGEAAFFEGDREVEDALDPERWRFEARAASTGGVHIIARDISMMTNMREHFEKHVGTSVLQKIMDNGITDEAERQDVTMLFADLRGFTTVSRDMTPEAVRGFINDFLHVSMDVVDAWEGSVDKIVGDEVMALFGAPLSQADDPFRAVLCAVEMQRAHQELQAQYQDQGMQMPDMGIGINTGPVVVGHIGSGRRVDYTVIGHHVNFAARLCSKAKAGQVLVSAGTVSAIRDFSQAYPDVEMPKLRLKPADAIDAKGIGENIEVFEAR